MKTPADKKVHKSKKHHGEQELVGVFSWATFRSPNGDFIIGKLSDGKCVVGNPGDTELKEGNTYRFFGKNVVHDKFGEQFKFSCVIQDTPLSEDGVVKYLVDNVKGVGFVKARELFDLYKDRAVDVLSDNPEEVVKTGILNAEQANQASSLLKSMVATRSTTIELLSVFAKRGFPKKLIQQLIERWGVSAAAEVKKNPFQLLTEKFRGCGFKSVDKLYLDLGHDPASIQRQMFCAWHAINSDMSGNTWFPTRKIFKAIQESVASSKCDPVAAIEAGVKDGWLTLWSKNSDLASKKGYVAERKKAQEESLLSKELKRLLSSTNVLWPTDIPNLSEHQDEQAKKALSQQIAILVGTPGCLASDTELIYLRGKRNGGRTITIENLYKKFNGIPCNSKQWIDLDEPTYLHSMFPDGTVAYNQIISVLDSGIKEAIRITFSDGSFLSLTEDHPVAVSNGDFVEAGSLSVGDKVLAKGSMKPTFQGGKEIKNRPPRIIVNTKYHPGPVHVTNGCRYVRVPRSRLVIEAEMNGMTYDGFLYCVKNEPDSLSRFEFLPSDLEVHHKDEDTLNDDFTNLKVMSKENHSRLHGPNENFNVEYLREVEVVSIDGPLPVHTYDIQMESPANNFAANGIIVHNTGKTYTAAAIIKAVIQHHGAAAIAACAPTGKAAVRLTQSMLKNEVPIKATTIHSLLKYAVNDDGELDFEFGPKKKLPQRFFVVDEFSMCGTGLTARFLSALPDNAHVIFIGDKHQLPPVEHGAPLRDMLKCMSSIGELSQIFRNSGDIVLSCASIKNGGKMIFCKKFDDKLGKNLRLIRSTSPQEQIEYVEDFFKACIAKKIDPMNDVQLIVPLNAKSPTSREQLNPLLQNLLNPSGHSVEGCKYRIGDKIICLKNSRLWEVKPKIASAFKGAYKGQMKADAVEDYEISKSFDDKVVEHYVANGEIGRVVAVHKSRVIAVFDNPYRLVSIGMFDEGDDVKHDMAYAITGHKMQGSQAKYIIVIADSYPGANFICSREWWYTAISRAEYRCLVIGDPKTIQKHCCWVSIEDRKTFLVKRIEGHAKTKKTKTDIR